MENYLLHRMAPAAHRIESGRQYLGFSMLELIQENLTAHGIKHRGLPKLEMVNLGFQSTSDFPKMFENVSNKRMRQAYEENRATYRI